MGFMCLLISVYFVSLLSLLSLFRLPRRGLPRPILTTTGYHACVYIPVITPELSRSTIQVHRVITPAISNSYLVVYLSPAFTPAVLLLHHHRAPHATTYSTQRALRCQLRGRPFHPWAGRLRFSGAAMLTQSSSFSCGAGLQSESRLLLCCAP